MTDTSPYESQELYRLLLETSPDGVLVMDERGTIVSANPAVEQIFGRSTGELVGRPMAVLIPERFRRAHREGVERYLATGRRNIPWNGVQLPGLHQNGEEIPLEISFGTFVHGAHRYFAGFVRDVSERARQQRELEETAAELEETAAELETTVEDLQARGAELQSVNLRLEAVQRIFDASLSHLLMDELLEELLSRIQTVLGADAVTVLLCTADGSALRVEASVGLEDERARDVVVPVGQGVAGKIAETREPLMLDDVTQMEVINPLLRRLRSLIGVPLVLEGRLLGVLHAGTVDHRQFDAEELALFEMVASRVASAIEHARLFEASQEANRAKSDFLAVMSHELRTPLSAVMGYTELLLEEISGPVLPKQREQLERIRISSRHLLQLIEEVLAFSRVEAGREEVRVETVDVRSLLEEVAVVIEPLASEKELAFRVDAPTEAVEMETDPGKVRQILVNLLSNAVKFTDAGEVRLCAIPAGDRVRFEVADTGIGIAPEHRELIFEPFRQVEQAMTRTTGGTGLGLSIARSLTQLLHGEISVESAPGDGSRFRVALPRRRRPAE